MSDGSGEDARCPECGYETRVFETEEMPECPKCDDGLTLDATGDGSFSEGTPVTIKEPTRLVLVDE